MILEPAPSARPLFPCDLEKCIYKTCMEDAFDGQIIWPICVGKNFIRTLAVGLTFWGETTGIAIFGKPAGNNVPLKICLIASGVGGFGTLTSWLLIKILNEVMHCNSPEEKKIKEGQISQLARVSSLGISTIMGFGSLVPTAYLVYHYNNKSIGDAILVMLANVSLPIRSMQLAIDQGFKRKCCSNIIEERLLEAKNKMSIYLDCFLKDFLKMNKSNQLTLIATVYETISEFVDKHGKAKAYMGKIYEKDFSLELAPVMSTKDALILHCRKIAVITILPFAFALLSHYWVGGKKGFEEFSDNQIGSFSFAAFTVICNIYIIFNLLGNLTISTYNTTVDIVQGRFVRSLATQLRPTTAIVGKVAATALAAFGWGSTVQVTNDFFSPGSFADFIKYASSIAKCALMLEAMFSAIEEIIPVYERNSCNTEEKQIAEFYHRIQKLQELFDNCSAEEFAKFIIDHKEMPYLNEILINLNLTVDDIQAYIPPEENTPEENAPEENAPEENDNPGSVPREPFIEDDNIVQMNQSTKRRKTAVLS